MSARDDFVLYRGDEVLAIGNAQELAKKLKTTTQQIRLLASPKRVARADATQDSQQLVAIRVATPGER